MKAVTTWKVAALAVVVGSCLASGTALAGGSQVRKQSGNANGQASRTGTTVSSGVKQMDQTRDRLRDGSCVATTQELRDRSVIRARDGSCLTK